MASQVDMLVIALGLALMLIVSLASFVNLRRLISRLNSNHHVLWLKMNCPNAVWFTISRGGNPIDGIGGVDISLGAWLSTKSYLDLNDPAVTKAALRYAFLVRVGLAVVVVLISYGLLRYFGVVNGLTNGWSGHAGRLR